MKQMRFEGKVALVTGAASGIGRCTALQIAAEGGQVLACDIDTAGLTSLVEASAGSAGVISAFELNVTDSARCNAAVDAVCEQFGKLDVLCNIAGVVQTNHFHDLTDADWDRVMSINVNSVFYLCRAAIPKLKQSRGNIVNLASVAGIMGQAYTASYCASKAAVVMLTKSLAIEYAAAGIRANAICPGGVNTPLVAKFSAPDDVDFNLMARYMPLTEMSEPEEVADLVLFLASDAARSINGVAMPIDSGVSAG